MIKSAFSIMDETAQSHNDLQCLEVESRYFQMAEEISLYELLSLSVISI